MHALHHIGSTSRRGIFGLAAAMIGIGGFVGTASAAYVAPVGATASTDNIAPAARKAVNTINGSGFIGADSQGTHAAHTSLVEDTIWTSNGNLAAPNDHAPYLEYDFGAVSNVTGMHIWNGNQSCCANEVPRLVNILAGTSAGLGAANFIGQVEIPQNAAEGTDNYTGVDVPSFPALNGVQFVRLEIVSSWAGGTFNSLNSTYAAGGPGGRSLVNVAEVRFVTDAAPEPAALSVIAFGAMGLLARRRTAAI